MSPDDQHELVEQIAHAATDRGLTVATAESLTCGLVVNRLGTGPQASQWLAGSVVAYTAEVKFALLGVTRGPVITARCARELATGARKLVGADATVGITGCGGPEPEEDQPPGTVFIAAATPTGLLERQHQLEADDPETVLDDAASAALALLHEALTGR